MPPEKFPGARVWQQEKGESWAGPLVSWPCSPPWEGQEGLSSLEQVLAKGRSEECTSCTRWRRRQMERRMGIPLLYLIAMCSLFWFLTLCNKACWPLVGFAPLPLQERDIWETLRSGTSPSLKLYWRSLIKRSSRSYCPFSTTEFSEDPTYNFSNCERFSNHWGTPLGQTKTHTYIHHKNETKTKWRYEYGTVWRYQQIWYK